MREIFIRLYAADYMGLEELKHSQVSAASNPNTAFGLVSNLFTGMKKLVNERTKASRYEPIVAQYALIKTNTFGLCAESSVQFAVDHKTVETWRNGYGVVVSQKTSDNGRTYFEVPKRFARTISDAKTTSEWSQYAAGIGRMIKRHGGCQSGVLKTLEDNMLRYQSWVPKT